MDVKIKKLITNVEIPKYAKPGDAGLDLTAMSMLNTTEFIEYGTGLAIEIPPGYVGLVFPRSSVSKKQLTLANSVGVIDSGYRGEIKLRFKTKRPVHAISPDIYALGDKIGQLVILPYPEITLIEAEDLSDTDRGEGGFGSTDVEPTANVPGITGGIVPENMHMQGTL